MLRLVLVALVASVAYGASVAPPLPASTMDQSAPDTTVDMTPDEASTAAPPMQEVTTDAVTDDVTTAEPDTTTAEPVITTPGQIPCRPSLDQINAVFDYTNTADFKLLSENQQILVYELLAAGESCKLREFITVATTQRILLLLEDLPMKYVYLLTSFVTRNLEKEGVVVPV